MKLYSLFIGFTAVMLYVDAKSINDEPFVNDHSRRATSPDKSWEGLCFWNIFKFACKWVQQDGIIVNSATRPGPNFLQVAATTKLDMPSFNTGANIVKKVVQHMPKDLFLRLATNDRVGFYTKDEGLSVFPEYTQMKDRPECQPGKCDGICSTTCTPDGRKWDSISGMGNIRIVALKNNFMCLPDDYYNHLYSVLVDAIAVRVYLRLTTTWKDKVTAAYQNAKATSMWDNASFAMSTPERYFRQASMVYFFSTFHSAQGGMATCGLPSGKYCASEKDAKAYLKSKDPQMYEVLAYAWNGQACIVVESGLTVCPTAA